MHYMQIYFCQIRIIFNTIYIITITFSNNVHTQISNILFAKKRNIYLRTILIGSV